MDGTSAPGIDVIGVITAIATLVGAIAALIRELRIMREDIIRSNEAHVLQLIGQHEQILHHKAQHRPER